SNGYATVEYDGGSETLFICTSATPITSCDATSETVAANVYLGADYPRVTVTVSPSFAVTFDRRGFARHADGTITFATADGAVARTLAVSPTGRVTVTGG